MERKWIKEVIKVKDQIIFGKIIGIKLIKLNVLFIMKKPLLIWKKETYWFEKRTKEDSFILIGRKTEVFNKKEGKK